MNNKFFLCAVALLITLGGVFLYIRSQSAPKLEPVDTVTLPPPSEIESSSGADFKE